MKKLLLLFAIASLAFASCSKDSDEPEKGDPIDSILGKWTVTHTRSPDETIFSKRSSNEYFLFRTDKTCDHYWGDDLKRLHRFTFTYDSTNKIITCKGDVSSPSQVLSIQVEFENENQAIFHQFFSVDKVTRTQ